MWITRNGQVLQIDDAVWPTSGYAAKGWTQTTAPKPAPPPSAADLALEAADALITAQIRLDACAKLLLAYPENAALKAHQKAAQDQVTASVSTVTAAVDPVTVDPVITTP